MQLERMMAPWTAQYMARVEKTSWALEIPRRDDLCLKVRPEGRGFMQKIRFKLDKSVLEK